MSTRPSQEESAMSHQSPPTTTTAHHHSPPRRPRLSLQIKSLTTGPSIRTSRTLAAVVNPRSPTSFNTLTNVYTTAIDRSSAVTPVPVTAEPLTAINTSSSSGSGSGSSSDSSSSNSSNSKRLPGLPRLQMPSTLAGDRGTHTPYVATQFPETPLTAKPMSPAVAMELQLPSTMTSTPPLSAGPIDAPRQFCFSPADIQRSGLHAVRDHGHVDSEDMGDTTSESEASIGGMSDSGTDTPFPGPSRTASTPVTAVAVSRRRVPGLVVPGRPAPYRHNRGLHSILRNSPLPPPSAATPMSPRRQSQRLLAKANRHVMYNNPLTQTITTNLYTRSHVDLLCEEASPFASPASASPASAVSSSSSSSSASSASSSAASAAPAADRVLDLTLAYTGNETRDGGTTPGPFEEMRRRMAGLGTHSTANSTATTPISPGLTSPRAGGGGGGGIRKRRSAKKDRKRRWVWTLGQDEEEEATLSGAMIALKAAQQAKAEAAAAAEAAAESEAAAAAAAEAEAAAAAIDEATTPLAAVQLAHTLTPQRLPVVSEASPEMEMQDAGGGEVTGAGAGAGAVKRKRKSTPTPYATDSESDVAGDEADADADVDVDMQTPTTAHLQGAWLRQAAASAGVYDL